MPVAAPTERKWCPRSQQKRPAGDSAVRHCSISAYGEISMASSVLRSSPAFLLAQGRIRSAEKCCQMFNGSFEADTAARMRYQSGPQLFAQVSWPIDAK